MRFLFQGCFVGVIGKVGSGKSSLLNAILAEMQKQSGRVSLCPTTLSAGVGLVAQEAWIQHATVRDNILFGKPYNRTFYEATIHACALSEDLKVCLFAHFVSLFCASKFRAPVQMNTA